MLSKMKTRRYLLFALVAAAVVVGSLALLEPHAHKVAARTTEQPQVADQPPMDMSQARTLADQFSQLFEAASDKVGPSVVPIFAEQVLTTSDAFGGNEELFHQFFGDNFFKHFFQTPGGGATQTIHSLGSGVIVSEDGYILTNNHVVDDADKLTVVLSDGKKYTAKVVGTDPQTDVAVIKIDGDHLPAAKLGNSDDVSVGQWVIAVGNPFQLLHSVTAGIISAKGRSAIGLAAYEDFIQTDASINPGNSGGALADLDGNVIGINTAISSPSGASAGVGFAIPIKMAQNVMTALIDNGKVSRGYLALLPQDIDDNLAKAMNLKNTDGALVGDVIAGGPADKAGVKRGDVIVELDGKPIENSADLRNRVAEDKPDTRVDLTLLRDGKTKHIDVKLAERPNPKGETVVGQKSDEQGKHEKMGIEIVDATPEIARQLGYKDAQGVVISEVAAGSPAEEAGLRRGDLIKEVGNEEVDNVKDFDKAVSQSEKDGAVLLLAQRGQNTFYVAVELS